MATFSINPGMGSGDITGSINYLLANINQGLQANQGKGIISMPNIDPNRLYAYAFPYAYLAFADDIHGNGFSYDSDGKNFYGVRSIDIPPGVSFGSYPGNRNEFTWFEFLTTASATDVYYIVPAYYQLQVAVFSGITPPAGWQQWPGVLYPPFFIDLREYYAPATQTISNSEPLLFPTTYSVPFGINLTGGYDYNTDIYTSFTQEITYTTSSTTASNYLSVPNVYINQALNLQPLSAAPAVYSTGTIAVANRTGWDPASIGSGPPYVAFYNGSAWTKLG